MNVKKGENSMTVISLSPMEVMMLKDILNSAFEIYDDLDFDDLSITEAAYANGIARFAEELEASL